MSQLFDVFKFFEKPKSLKRIKNVLHKKFGAIDRIIQIRNNELCCEHNFKEGFICYGNLLVFIPKNMILLSCIFGEVETNECLQYFKTFLNGNFNDKSITIRYFIEGKVVEGATILILNNTNLNSIFEGTQIIPKYEHQKKELKSLGINCLP